MLRSTQISDVMVILVTDKTRVAIVCAVDSVGNIPASIKYVLPLKYPGSVWFIELRGWNCHHSLHSPKLIAKL